MISRMEQPGRKTLSRIANLLMIAAFLLSQGLLTARAAALSPPQADVFQKHIDYFDTEAGCPTDTSTQPTNPGGITPVGPVKAKAYPGDTINLGDTYKGKASVYGNDPVIHFVDGGDNNIPALPGASNDNPGIAVWNRGSLGGWWQVEAPNGKTAILQQTDLGPSTSRTVDINSVAARSVFGYKAPDFPTDNGDWTIQYMGKNQPSGAITKDSGGVGDATSTPGATQPTTCNCPGGGSLPGKTLAEKAFNYFVASPINLSPQAAAGIVGNMMTESGSNTETLDTHAHNNISGTHDGIVQWSGTRWAALQQHENGKDIYALTTQLDYVWYELQNGYSSTLSGIKNASTARDAATVFNNTYEVSGDNSGNREANAQRIFGEYGSAAGGGAGGGGGAAGAASCPGTTGGPVNIIKHDAFGNADGLMGHQPTMIGLHYTGSNEQTVDQLVQDLSDPTGAKHCNRSCSVQLTVDPKGNVYQLTSSLDVITENIINFNDADIGIEVMGADEQTLLNNTVQYNAVVSVVAQLMKQYNIKMVEDFSNKAGLMGHMECDAWSQAHLGSNFGGIYSHDPSVKGTDSHTDPGSTYMSKVRSAVGPLLN